MDNTNIDKRIGARIVSIRTGLTIHGMRVTLSQEALSSATGISRSMLGRIERGEKSATPAQLALICHHLGITPNDLFCPPLSERFTTETFLGKIAKILLKRIW